MADRRPASSQLGHCTQVLCGKRQRENTGAEPGLPRCREQHRSSHRHAGNGLQLLEEKSLRLGHRRVTRCTHAPMSEHSSRHTGKRTLATSVLKASPGRVRTRRASNARGDAGAHGCPQPQKTTRDTAPVTPPRVRTAVDTRSKTVKADGAAPAADYMPIGSLSLKRKRKQKPGQHRALTRPTGSLRMPRTPEQTPRAAAPGARERVGLREQSGGHRCSPRGDVMTVQCRRGPHGEAVTTHGPEGARETETPPQGHERTHRPWGHPAGASLRGRGRAGRTEPRKPYGLSTGPTNVEALTDGPDNTQRTPRVGTALSGQGGSQPQASTVSWEAAGPHARGHHCHSAGTEGPGHGLGVGRRQQAGRRWRAQSSGHSRGRP